MNDQGFETTMEVETNAVENDKYVLLQDMYLKGDDIQKLSIIQTLPQLVKIDQQATFTRIVPKIQQELPKASAEFQITTSQIFRVLIEKKLPVNLLSAVIQGVDCRDPIVSSAWMDTLLAVIPFLNIDVIKREILPLISTKAQFSQPVIQRVAACRIIGKIANHKDLKSPDIKKDILPFVHSLCQDCSVEVRAIMCVQLPAVAEGLTMPLVRINLLASYIELASDTSPLVREAAVLTMVNLLPFLERDILESTIGPLLKRFCEKRVPEDNTAAIISSQFGRILKFLGPLLNNDDKSWCLGYFKILSRKGFETRVGHGANFDASKDVICRENCATNFPAVAEFVNSKLPGQLDLLYSIFRDLTSDPCYIVRKAIAGCVHDVAKILASQNKMLKADIVRLLRDDAEDVLQMLVPKLSVTLQLLAQYGYLSKDRTDQTTMEISRALLKCQIELSKGYNWRLLVSFIEQLECLPKCIPGDFIHQHFTPTILGTATNGRVKPIVYQSTKTMLVFLRNNNKENQQKWMRDSLINQFCYSDSCYTRQTFVKICFNVLDVFSSKYFKDYFFIPLLCLASDRVSNVRYSFITILPKLKLVTLCPPLDPKHKILLQEAIQRLESNEKEKYILERLRKTVREIANISIAGNKEFYSKDLAKQDEENRGGQVARPMTTFTGPQAGRARAAMPNRPIQNRPMQNRPIQNRPMQNRPNISVQGRGPPKSGQAAIDMNFLEQHFYIDAGVTLPETLSPTAETTDAPIETILPHIPSVQPQHNTFLTVDTIDHADMSGGLSEAEIEIIENITPNMTDDVKVNLRKIGNQASKSTIPLKIRSSNIPISDYSPNITLKNKRHSSIFSMACLDKNKNLHKRHSLNLQSTKDLSKIPVCTRKRSVHRNTLSDFLGTAQLSRELNDIEHKVNSIFIKSETTMTDEKHIIGNQSSDKLEDTHTVTAKTSGLPVAIRRRK